MSIYSLYKETSCQLVVNYFGKHYLFTQIEVYFKQLKVSSCHFFPKLRTKEKLAPKNVIEQLLVACNTLKIGPNVLAYVVFPFKAPDTVTCSKFIVYVRIVSTEYKNTHTHT